MHYIFNRRILFGFTLIALVFGGLALQRPTKSTESAVVFSNMQGSNDVSSGSISPAVDTVVIFDVPVGPDYQINSVQVVISAVFCCQITIARIHADNAGDVGPVVVDLGERLTPQGITTLTFSPTGAALLPNGGRYWLVLTNWGGLGVRPMSADPPITPTGVFTHVDSGYIGRGIIQGYTSIPQRHNLSIDADPIGIILVNDEAWRTVAIYCQPDSVFDVYGITDGAGWLAFRMTQEEIDAVGIPAENTLLKQSEDGSIRLYRLNTGEFQVNAPRWDAIWGNIPDGYVYIWEPDQCE